MAAGAISTSDVSKASAELARMRRSLSSWLKYRQMNDAVMAGTRPTKKPLAYAQQVVATSRDYATEQKLANQLHILLEQVYPDSQLPNPDLGGNANAAVQLAQIAISGTAPPASASPTATGGLMTGMPPWLLPVLIVSGLLIAVVTAINSAADVAKEKEQYACIEAGACTDYGFWLKAAAVAGIGYLVWFELGVGERVKRSIRGRG